VNTYADFMQKMLQRGKQSVGFILGIPWLLLVISRWIRYFLNGI